MIVTIDKGKSKVYIKTLIFYPLLCAFPVVLAAGVKLCKNSYGNQFFWEGGEKAVFWIRKFVCHPDPLVRGTYQYPSIIEQK